MKSTYTSLKFKIYNETYALLDRVCKGQAAFDRGRDLTIVHIYFSAEFDRVSDFRLLFKLLMSKLVELYLMLKLVS